MLQSFPNNIPFWQLLQAAGDTLLRCMQGRRKAQQQQKGTAKGKDLLGARQQCSVMQIQFVDMGLCLVLLELNKWIESSLVRLYRHLSCHCHNSLAMLSSAASARSNYGNMLCMQDTRHSFSNSCRGSSANALQMCIHTARASQHAGK